MQKTVTLFGGSFNPPHEGHLEMAAYLHRTLGTDETWMLFSQSIDKDPKAYMSLEHRMAMAQILAKHYPEPIVMSDEEAKIAAEIGRNDTYYILEGLRHKFPGTKFVFAMGADSFAGFHNWKERDEIMQSTLVAVVARPGYTKAALTSPTAIKFAEQMIDITQPDAVRNACTGWCFLDNPKIDSSSSDLLRRLNRGDTHFDGHFAEVADYICRNGLYQTCGTTPQQHIRPYGSPP